MNLDGRFQPILDHLREELATLRAGRATPALLEHIRVDYYGTPTPLQQVASITSPEPMQLIVQPWDPSCLQAIEKAIRSSDLGVQPAVDGTVVRVTLPTLTEERRRDLLKVVHQKAEASRIAVRNVREEEMNTIRAQERDGDLSEDDADRIRDDIQEAVTAATADIDAMTKKKEAELTE